MKKIYYAIFKTNTGTCSAKAYQYTNKKLAIDDIKIICKGNICSGGSGVWQVSDARGEIIKSGSIVANW